MTQEEQEAQHDLGLCRSIDADSIGPPGQRHFRLRIMAEQGSAHLWLEKEQLQELGVAIKQMLRSEIGEAGDVAPPATEVTRAPDYDLKAARLALGRHSQRQLYVLMAYEEESEEDRATLALWAEAQQLDRLADQAFEVCAAGRPRCFLCGAPLNEGETHVCPRANGHVRA